MQVIVDGLMTQYVRGGRGKTVLLLHGWGDSLQTFDRLNKTLSDAFDVIAVDLPGFGKTESPPKPWDLTDYAGFVAAFLAKIGAQDVEAIIAHSNGGAISIRGLGRKLFKTNKLVLLASSGIRGEYKGRSKALRIITKAGKLITKPLPKSVKKGLRKTVYETVGSDMLVAEHLQETFKLVVTDDVQNDAATLKIPTLLIFGSNDTATPARYADRFHKLIPDSKVEILPGAGHFIHHDKPDKVEQLIVGFLR